VREKTTLVPDLMDRDWIPLDTSRDGNVPGPVWKPLTADPETGACSYLMHLPPNWHDNELDIHPTVEEGYVLRGGTTLGDPALDTFGPHPVGNYMYRPPNIIHGPARASKLDGATLFQRMSGELRILRYEKDDFPQKHKQPVTDEWKTWPIPWEEEIDTTSLPDEPSTGGWEGTTHRWVYRNKETNGGCVIITVPAGWTGTGSACRGSVEEFVIEGTLVAGGVEFPQWGYAYRHPGDPAGNYASPEGARILCLWDEADEMAEA
jgi:hypothetical protein